MNNNNDNVLLKVENLCQYFKMGKTELKAVDNVSFEVKKGEVFGLVGESGCGKTTTGRSIIKLYDITSGNVYFKGQRICAGIRSYKENIKKAKNEYKEALSLLKKNKNADAETRKALNDEVVKKYEKYVSVSREESENIAKAKHDQKKCDKDYALRKVEEVKEKYNEIFKKELSVEEHEKYQREYKEEIRLAKKERLVTQIQMIFQDPIASLDPRMTVKDIISEGLIIKGYKDKKVIEDKVYEVLELVGLVREHASRYPHEFSGGQRQRIGVARSIIMNPDLIIADEPVSALDVSIQAQVINLLNELRKKLGLTLLFVAHDLSVVKYFSDWIGVMYFGKMVELARADELFKHPVHPYTRSLLSAIPLPDPEYEKRRKRITYNPLASHDYTLQQPTFKELFPEHFVMCNDEEFEKYKKEFE